MFSRFGAKKTRASSSAGKLSLTGVSKHFQLSRNRRVHDLVVRLEVAEQALASANHALAALRELASAGSSKVMP